MSEVRNGALPKSWKRVPLAECCEIILGQSPPGSTYNTEGHGLPFFQGKAEFGDLFPQVEKWCSEPKKVAEKGDVLISVRAPVGPTNLAAERSAIGRGLAAIRGHGGIPSRYILYALRAQESEIAGKGTGSTFSSISGKQLREIPINLAPLAEQYRIVGAVESHLTRLDAAVSALERVRVNLKRYRASVLKAACEGRLVPTEAELARREGRDYEPADVLLERILEERRARWEAEELAKLKAKGKEPTDDRWKRRYKEPQAPDTTGLPELPEGWVWASVEQLAGRVEYGTSARSAPEPPGIPVLRMGNIVDGRLVLDDLKYLEPGHEDIPRLLLEQGDLLFNRTNSAELVGKTAVYLGNPDPCTFASYLIRVRFVPGADPRYISVFINSPLGRGWIASVVSQQVGQANVNATKLNALAVPLPPEEEQRRIMVEVDRRLSIADAVESALASQLKSATRLRQSILKRAFEGRLVPQDPSDEPASVLLERIRAERGSHAGGGKGARGRRATVQVLR